MRFKKVMLVLPEYVESHYRGLPRLRAGVGYISESLTRAKIDNTVFDMELGYSISDLIKRIESFKPDLVAIRMMTFRYKHNYSILQKIKKHFPKIKIVVGGPHMSVMRDHVLKECDAIDFGSVLEGEELIVELCKGKQITSIKGLIHRKNNKTIYNGDRQFIENLDNVPFPKFQKFEIEKYPKAIDIVTSRGCPYHCIYCPVRLAMGSKFRCRSAKNVVDEIEYWYKKGYRAFEFVDDNFTLVSDRVFQICDDIEKRGLRELRLSCGNGVRADRVTKEMLKRMKDVGFYLLAFGVESGCEEILKNLKKGEKLKDIEEAVKNACELGFRVELFFLIGSIGETYEDVLKSFRFALKYPVARANFYNIVPFPHTELYKWVESNNLFLKKSEEYLDSGSAWIGEPLYMTPTMTFEERIKALKKSKLIRRKIEQRFFALFLKSKGIPSPMRDFIAFVYSHDNFKNIIARFGLVYRIKELIKF